MRSPAHWVGMPVVIYALLAASAAARADDLVLVKKGKAKVTIYTPVPVEASKDPKAPPPGRDLLRESVKDLAGYLGKITGTRIDVVTGQPPTEPTKTIPILIGELGAQRFGPPGQKSASKQGFRIVVTKKAIGLYGESDEATSYAIYEILDRLGCRWYLPGDVGEVIPTQATIAFPAMDVSLMPPMLYRNIWYASPEFKRRNRLGGQAISGAHGLEGYITAEQFKEHPDWAAEFGGKRVPGRICWGNPEVSAAVADSILRILDRKYQPSVTLSPGDGTDFCECAKCRALDTGDQDPTMGCVSISDRLIHFCNQIAEKVTAKYPDVLFGLYAYVQYTRPPLREKPHPSIVIALAPITYCRAHSMANPTCPSRQSIRPVVEGWGKVARSMAFRGYLFNLAEVNAPYPMISLWSDEFPIYYGSGVKFWMPESMPTFEGGLPGLYLNVRMPWHPETPGAAILDEFYARFYGAAAEPMRRYWQTMDDAWTKVPEHAGNCFGYARRFTPETMAAARKAMNDALATSQTAMEYRRVKFADDSLRQFERLMKLRWDLADGRLANLEQEAERWLATWAWLADEYAPLAAFGRYQGDYFRRFFTAIYSDGSRLARDFRLLGPPIRQWRYQVDRENQGASLRWEKPEFDDKAWKTTDPCVETWSTLDLFNYFGSVWYRARAKVPPVPAGKKVYLWMACTDGACKLFVNGIHVPYVNAKGETAETFVNFSAPGSFDITAAVKPGAENQFTVIGTRGAGWINELGTGGLMGPVLLYAEK